MEAVAVQAAVEAASEQANPYAVSQRCTGSVRLALLHARRETEYRGELLVTTRDLLAGLCEQEDTRAERIGSLKEHSSYLRWVCKLPQHPWTKPSKPAKVVEPPASYASSSASPCKFDAEANRVLTYAIAEADRDGEHWIDSDHLLRGLLRFPNHARSALVNIELNLTLAREASVHDRDRYKPEDVPKQSMIDAIMDALTGKHAPHLRLRLFTAACYAYIFMDAIVSGFQHLFMR